jgi:hypothetical protein
MCDVSMHYWWIGTIVISLHKFIVHLQMHVIIRWNDAWKLGSHDLMWIGEVKSGYYIVKYVQCCANLLVELLTIELGILHLKKFGNLFTYILT